MPLLLRLIVPYPQHPGKRRKKETVYYGRWSCRKVCLTQKIFHCPPFFSGGVGAHCRVDPSGKQTISAVNDSVSYEDSYRAARAALLGQLFTITMTAVVQMKVMIMLRQPNAIYRPKSLDRVTMFSSNNSLILEILPQIYIMG